MTSFSSVLTRAPITPREVSRRYSKLLFALKILKKSDEGLNYCTFLCSRRDKEREEYELEGKIAGYPDETPRTAKGPERYRLDLTKIRNDNDNQEAVIT